jgi:isocitrate dehydrogenase kinase/phosphatase
MRLDKEFKAEQQPMDVWEQVKLHYIGLLVNHHQPELAETFFNSVTTKILQARLLPERLHLRAAGGLHRIHRERRARRPAHLPLLLPHARHHAGRGARMIEDFDLRVPFDDLGATPGWC